MQDDVNSGTANLTEREELLLMRFVDNDVHFLDRWRAQGLLRSNSQARAYVNSLQQVSKVVQSRKLPDISGTEFWAQVSNRITQEERAELFLGKRGAQGAQQLERTESWWRLPRMAWAVSGMALASIAYVAVVVTPARLGTEQQFAVAGEESATQNTQLVRAGRPELLEERTPHIVQVDWMHSDGRLSIQKEPTDRSAIIWVKRRAASGSSLDRTRSLPELAMQPTPQSSSSVPQFDR
jgi:hypothetical protein